MAKSISNPQMQEAFSRLVKAAQAKGYAISLNDADRTEQEQAALRARAEAGKSRYPAAKPGTSRHERGEAVDLSVFRGKDKASQAEIAELAAQHGFKWAGDSDAVHFTYVGGAASSDSPDEAAVRDALARRRGGGGVRASRGGAVAAQPAAPAAQPAPQNGRVGKIKPFTRYELQDEAAPAGGGLQLSPEQQAILNEGLQSYGAGEQTNQSTPAAQPAPAVPAQPLPGQPQGQAPAGTATGAPGSGQPVGPPTPPPGGWKPGPAAPKINPLGEAPKPPVAPKTAKQLVTQTEPQVKPTGDWLTGKKRELDAEVRAFEKARAQLDVFTNPIRYQEFEVARQALNAKLQAYSNVVDGYNAAVAGSEKLKKGAPLNTAMERINVQLQQMEKGGPKKTDAQAREDLYRTRDTLNAAAEFAQTHGIPGGRITVDPKKGLVFLGENGQPSPQLSKDFTKFIESKIVNPGDSPIWKRLAGLFAPMTMSQWDATMQRLDPKRHSEYWSAIKEMERRYPLPKGAEAFDLHTPATTTIERDTPQPKGGVAKFINSIFPQPKKQQTIVENRARNAAAQLLASGVWPGSEIVDQLDEQDRKALRKTAQIIDARGRFIAEKLTAKGLVDDSGQEYFMPAAIAGDVLMFYAAKGMGKLIAPAAEATDQAIASRLTAFTEAQAGSAWRSQMAQRLSAPVRFVSGAMAKGSEAGAFAGTYAAGHEFMAGRPEYAPLAFAQSYGTGALGFGLANRLVGAPLTGMAGEAAQNVYRDLQPLAGAGKLAKATAYLGAIGATTAESTAGFGLTGTLQRVLSGVRDPQTLAKGFVDDATVGLILGPSLMIGSMGYQALRGKFSGRGGGPGGEPDGGGDDGPVKLGDLVTKNPRSRKDIPYVKGQGGEEPGRMAPIQDISNLLRYAEQDSATIHLPEGHQPPSPRPGTPAPGARPALQIVQGGIVPESGPIADVEIPGSEGGGAAPRGAQRYRLYELTGDELMHLWTQLEGVAKTPAEKADLQKLQAWVDRAVAMRDYADAGQWTPEAAKAWGEAWVKSPEYRRAQELLNEADRLTETETHPDTPWVVAQLEAAARRLEFQHRLDYRAETIKDAPRPDTTAQEISPWRLLSAEQRALLDPVTRRTLIEEDVLTSYRLANVKGSTAEMRADIAKFERGGQASEKARRAELAKLRRDWAEANRSTPEFHGLSEAEWNALDPRVQEDMTLYHMERLQDLRQRIQNASTRKGGAAADTAAESHARIKDEGVRLLEGRADDVYRDATYLARNPGFDFASNQAARDAAYENARGEMFRQAGLEVGPDGEPVSSAVEPAREPAPDQPGEIGAMQANEPAPVSEPEPTPATQPQAQPTRENGPTPEVVGATAKKLQPSDYEPAVPEAPAELQGVLDDARWKKIVSVLAAMQQNGAGTPNPSELQILFGIDGPQAEQIAKSLPDAISQTLQRAEATNGREGSWPVDAGPEPQQTQAVDRDGLPIQAGQSVTVHGAVQAEPAEVVATAPDGGVTIRYQSDGHEAELDAAAAKRFLTITGTAPAAATGDASASPTPKPAGERMADFLDEDAAAQDSEPARPAFAPPTSENFSPLTREGLKPDAWVRSAGSGAKLQLLGRIATGPDAGKWEAIVHEPGSNMDLQPGQRVRVPEASLVTNGEYDVHGEPQKLAAGEIRRDGDTFRAGLPDGSEVTKGERVYFEGKARGRGRRYTGTVQALDEHDGKPALMVELDQAPDAVKQSGQNAPVPVMLDRAGLSRFRGVVSAAGEVIQPGEQVAADLDGQTYLGTLEGETEFNGKRLAKIRLARPRVVAGAESDLIYAEPGEHNVRPRATYEAEPARQPRREPEPAPAQGQAEPEKQPEPSPVDDAPADDDGISPAMRLELMEHAGEHDKHYNPPQPRDQWEAYNRGWEKSGRELPADWEKHFAPREEIGGYRRGDRIETDRDWSGRSNKGTVVKLNRSTVMVQYDGEDEPYSYKPKGEPYDRKLDEPDQALARDRDGERLLPGDTVYYPTQTQRGRAEGTWTQASIVRIEPGESKGELIVREQHALTNRRVKASLVQLREPGTEPAPKPEPEAPEALARRAWENEAEPLRIWESAAPEVEPLREAFTQAAPEVLAAREAIAAGRLPDRNPTPQLVAAANLFAVLKAAKSDVGEFVNLADLYPDEPSLSPLNASMLLEIERHRASAERLQALLREYFAVLRQVGTEDADLPTVEEIWAAAVLRVNGEQTNAPNPNATPSAPAAPAAGGAQPSGPASAAGSGQAAEAPGVLPGTAELIAAIQQALPDLTHRRLLDLARQAYGGSRGNGSWEIKDAYDALEVALHNLIRSERAALATLAPASIVKRAGDLLATAPRQRQDDRTREQERLQQFSTPLHLAYLAALAAEIVPGEVALEPSAGTGTLALWAEIAGASVHANEISPRRAGLLQMQGFPVTHADASLLDAALDPSVQPSVIVMNPPFSSTGRDGERNHNGVGQSHVRQALQRLAPGGRLVALLGEGAAWQAPRFRPFWEEMQRHYSVRMVLSVAGDIYASNATHFGTTLIVIDKTGPTADPAAVLAGSAGTVEDVLNAIERLPARPLPATPLGEGAGELDAGAGSGGARGAGARANGRRGAGSDLPDDERGAPGTAGSPVSEGGPAGQRADAGGEPAGDRAQGDRGPGNGVSAGDRMAEFLDAEAGPEPERTTPKEPWEMTLSEYADTPAATRGVPELLRRDLSKDTLETLLGLSSKDLGILATVMGSKRSGSKRAIAQDLLDTWALRTRLKNETLETLQQLSATELNELMKASGQGTTGNKASKAARLLNWREGKRNHAKITVAQAKHEAAVRKALAEGKPVSLEIASAYPALLAEFPDQWPNPYQVGDRVTDMRAHARGRITAVNGPMVTVLTANEVSWDRHFAFVRSDNARPNEPATIIQLNEKLPGFMFTAEPEPNGKLKLVAYSSPLNGAPGGELMDRVNRMLFQRVFDDEEDAAVTAFRLATRFLTEAQRGQGPAPRPEPQPEPAPGPQNGPSGDLGDLGDLADLGQSLGDFLGGQKFRSTPRFEALSQQLSSAEVGRNFARLLRENAEFKAQFERMIVELIRRGRDTFEPWNQAMGALIPNWSLLSERAQQFGFQLAQEEFAKQPEPAAEPAPAAGPTALTYGLNPAWMARQEEEGTGFVEYAPAKLAGGTGHPAKVVESASMAAVEPPDITYRPALPETIWTSGALSNVQAETVHYAGQRHEQRLPTGARAGILIGDGTGMGKGRSAAGVIADNWHQGRRRIVWVSFVADLAEDAKRDLAGIGYHDLAFSQAQGGRRRRGDAPAPATANTPSGEHIPLKLQGSFKMGDDLGALYGDGVLFTTYHTLPKGRPENGVSRLQQLKDWLGEDGVIIFDEAHKAKNAVVSGRGKPSAIGRLVIQIQDELPHARVSYFSATGATDVRNMGYMTRLGLWGPGTSFPEFQTFLNEIESAGLGAKEQVARDMKALGMYLARQISYGPDENGVPVEFSEATAELTPRQRQIYNTAAEIMQEILGSFEDALDLTEGRGTQSHRNATTQFWGTQQRFFRQVITALKVPKALELTQQALDEGKSVVIGLIGTAESRTAAMVNEAEAAGTDLEDLDFSPAETLAAMIDRFYPTVMYRIRQTENGTFKEPIRDPNDETRYLESPEAIRRKEALMRRVRQVQLPENPLDAIGRRFGWEAVAELTGRKKRLMVNPNTGREEYMPRNAGQYGANGREVSQDAINVLEMARFQKGEKRIAVISASASTGISLHSDKSAENQQRRVHITLELGWSADMQMQTFGRTHRSNQAIPPEYVLLASNVGGERRFISTIARRLASLGALTKGQRDAASAGGNEMAKYNFETRQGELATAMTYTLLETNQIEGVPAGRQALIDMGLIGRNSINGSVDDADRTDVIRFLNRVLALDMDRQNAIYEAFFNNFVRQIEMDRQSGSYDEGLTDLRAQSLVQKAEPTVVATEPTSGAKTYHYVLERTDPVYPVPWEEVQRQLTLTGPERAGFFKNLRSENVVFAEMGATRTDGSGATFIMWDVTRPTQRRDERITGEDLAQKWQRISVPDARAHWEDALANAPTERKREVHLIVGVVLPLWQRLKTARSSNLRVVRASLDDGTRVVGTEIPTRLVGDVLGQLGATGSYDTPEAIFDYLLQRARPRDRVQLVGGMTLKSITLDRERVIELEGLPDGFHDEIQRLGVIERRIGWEYRYFVPTDETRGVPVLKRLLDRFPALSGEEKLQEQAEGPTLSFTSAELDAAALARGELDYQLRSAGIPPALAFTRDPYFSHLAKQLLELEKDNPRMTGAQLQARLKKHGVKDEELAWTGLDDWLAEQEGSITPRQALNFVGQSLVEVQERQFHFEERTVIHATGPFEPVFTSMDGDEQGTAWYDQSEGGSSLWIQKNEGRYHLYRGFGLQPEELGVFDTLPAAKEAGREAAQDPASWESKRQIQETRWDRWAPQGYSQYHEIVLTVPQMWPLAPPFHVWKETYENLKDVMSRADWELIQYGAWSERRQVLQQTAYEAYGEAFAHLTTDEYRQMTAEYSHQHWQSVANPLAHLRVGIFKKPDGAEIPVLLEAQSDWHQAGRKHGYRPHPQEFKRQQAREAAAAAEAQEAITRYRTEGAALREQMKALEAEAGGKEFIVRDYNQAGNPVAYQGTDPQEAFRISRDLSSSVERNHGQTGPEWQRLNAALQSLYREQAAAREALQREENTTRGMKAAMNGKTVPTAPLKGQAWQKLLFRRMVRWAAEEGYTEFAWVPGEVANQALDMRAVIQEIEYSKHPQTGEWDLFLYRKRGEGDDADPQPISKHAQDDAALQELLGQELAEKLQRSEGEVTQEEDPEEYAAEQPFEDRVSEGGPEEAAPLPARLWRSLKGQGLKIGGEKNAKYYDELLLSHAKQFGKAFGIKPGKVEVVIQRNDAMRSYAEAEGVPAETLDQPYAVEMHHFPLTEELDALVEQGVPLFHLQKGEHAEDFTIGVPERVHFEKWDRATNLAFGDKSGWVVDWNAGLELPDYRFILESEVYQRFGQALVETVDQFAQAVWEGQPEIRERLTRVGLLFYADPGGWVNGMNLPDPHGSMDVDRFRAAVLVNLMAGTFADRNPADTPAKLALHLVNTLIHELAHMETRSEDAPLDRKMEEYRGKLGRMQLDAAIRFAEIFAQEESKLDGSFSSQFRTARTHYIGLFGGRGRTPRARFGAADRRAEAAAGGVQPGGSGRLSAGRDAGRGAARTQDRAGLAARSFTPADEDRTPFGEAFRSAHLRGYVDSLAETVVQAGGTDFGTFTERMREHLEVFNRLPVFQRRDFFERALERAGLTETDGPAPPPPGAGGSDDAEGGDPALPDKVRDFFNTNRGLATPQDWWGKFRDDAARIGRLFTRQWEHLEGGARHAEFRQRLTRLSHYRGTAGDLAMLDIADLIQGMTTEEYDLFNLRLIINDLREEIRMQQRPVEEGGQGRALADVQLPAVETEDGEEDLTPDEVERAHEWLNHVLADNPKVDQAVSRRREMSMAIRESYAGAMEAATGHRPDFQREDYYRHQVIAYARLHQAYRLGEVSGAPDGVKAPMGRGFLKRREGSHLAYNTEYIQAEHEVLSQMLYDTEVFRLLRFVQDTYNVLERAKLEVMRRNDAAVMPLFERMAEEYNRNSRAVQDGEIAPKEGRDMYRATLHWMQSAGFRKLEKFAADGLLPDTADRKWADLIQALAEQHQINRTREEEDVAAVDPTEHVKGQLLAYAGWLLREHGGEAGSGAAALIFKGIRNKQKFIKEEAGRNFWTVDRLLRDDPEWAGFVKWQPRDGNLIFRAWSITDRMHEAISQNALAELGVPEKHLRKVLVLGPQRPSLILPREIAETLNQFHPYEQDPVFGFIDGLAKGLTNKWKQSTLLGPHRAFMYNLRNLTGDAEAVFVGNPDSFFHAQTAMRELHAVMFKGQKPTSTLRDWLARGGLQSLLQVAERMGSQSGLKLYARLKGHDPEQAFMGVRAWRKYWSTARLLTDYREAILRYASYLSYLHQLRKAEAAGGTRPENYGASIPAEVDALPTVEDKAFKLSNDLLGAYDEVSSVGQWMRERVAPFWSWKEVNTKRYAQLWRNVAADRRIAGHIGRRIAAAALGGTVRAGITAFNLGRLVIKTAGFWALAATFNLTLFPAVEQSLPIDVRSRPHVILSADRETGDVGYWSRLGSSSDAVAWFGLDDSPFYGEALLNGRMTAGEVAQRMFVEAPLNEIYQSLSPAIKTLPEVALGKETFPDVFRPRPTRDTGEKVARIWGVDAEYRIITGKPTKGLADYLSRYLMNHIDPEEVNYSAAVGARMEHLRRQGKPMGGSEPTPRSNALYYYKQALRWGDRQAAKRYMAEYERLGGNAKGLRRSLQSLNPLYGIKYDDRAAYIEHLSAYDREKLLQAVDFYAQMVTGTQVYWKPEPGATTADQIRRVLDDVDNWLYNSDELREMEQRDAEEDRP